MAKPYETSWATVYLNRGEKCFKVVAEAKRGLAKAEIGNPVVIADYELEARIAGTLIGFLDSFQTNLYSPEIARGGSLEENRIFVKNHLSVSVERLKSGDLVFRPLHHEQAGYVAKTGEQIVVSRNEIPGRIPGAIREAFALAS